MFDKLTLLQLIYHGGYTMIVLVVFSVSSLAVMLGRFWKFRAFKREMKLAFEALSSRVDYGGVDAALEYCETDKSALPLIFSAGYASRAGGRDDILRAMEIRARKAVGSLEAYLGVLGTIGSTAPFVGLFGTVVGIMSAFSSLAGSQGAGASVVADGIAEALVATAGGLLVAVPAVIGYNYFVRAAGRISVDLESAANEFVLPLSCLAHGDEPKSDQGD